LMGGTIRFKSRRKKGTTFVVELPFKLLKEDRKEDIQEEEYDFSQVFQGQRVLVVEDNEINLEIVQTFLESWNLEVDAAENGLIAVEKFKNSEPGWYQLVLMDIRMPVMDGLTATREIRALEREDAGTVPIMALTANVSPGDSQHAKKIGMNEYLTKPVEMKLLHRKIKEFI
ncbi:MAG: response regulator, partial [Lachnospiraceae bacterium]|nr:response regulator [Lachnospiraceae bacterium]